MKPDDCNELILCLQLSLGGKKDAIYRVFCIVKTSSCLSKFLWVAVFASSPIIISN